MTGRHWCGTAFGGWKARTEVPRLVQQVMVGEMSLDPFITHTFEGKWVYIWQCFTFKGTLETTRLDIMASNPGSKPQRLGATNCKSSTSDKL